MSRYIRNDPYECYRVLDGQSFYGMVEPDLKALVSAPASNT